MTTEHRTKSGPTVNGKRSPVELPRAEPTPLVEMATGHKKPVTTLAFAPDGRTLASGSDDTTLRLWDTATGEPCGVMNDSPWGVVVVAFSPDGKTVASVCQGVKEPVKRHTRAFLWDLIQRRSRELAGRRAGTFRFRAPCFAPAGDVLAVRHDTVRLYDTGTGEQLGDIPEGRGGECLAFTPDGTQLVSGFIEGTLYVWDIRRRTEVRTLKGHTGPVACVTFSPDGRLLASAGSCHGLPWQPVRTDRTIRLWDFEAGEELRRLAGDWDTTTHLAFLPGDGGLVSFHDPDGDATVRLWSPDIERAVAAWMPRGRVVRAVAVSPDGKVIATGDQSGVVQLWELRAVLNWR